MACTRATRATLTLLLALTLTLAALPAAPVARAAACVVTANTDGPDPGYSGTLRAALNDGTCAAITFDRVAMGSGQITLVGLLPAINRSLTITGPGADQLTISGGDARRLLLVQGGTVGLSGLTLAHGKALTPAGQGAGLRVTGGAVTLTGVTVRDNVSTLAGDISTGGGLFVKAPGRLDLVNSTVAGNKADYGGGLYVDNGATATLTDSTVSDNTAPGGGGAGIYNKQGTVLLTRSVVSDNISHDNGGGLANNQGTMTLTGSTVRGNRTNYYQGGGLYNDTGTLTLTNSTVSGNTAYYNGGGIYNSHGTATLTNSTISGNMAESSAGLVNDVGTLTLRAVTLVDNHATLGSGGLRTSGSAGSPASLHLAQSIIAGNFVGATPQDCTSATYAPLTSDGDNLVGSGTGCPTDGTGDLVLTSTLSSALDPVLANNGGPTRTHNVVPGGPAHDRIPSTRCGVTTDQRGVPRPPGTICDIGAVEYTAPPTSPSPSPSPSPSASPSTPSCGQRFGDVPAADPACIAIEALASRSIINGCDSSATPPLFCPADTTLRHQMAALIVRAMPGWSAETWPNTFTDPTDDAELWSRVATLQHYGVVNGYTAASCQAQGKTPPCYGPLDPVLKAQAISFVTRAMVAKGYWVQQPTDPTLYGGALVGTGHETDATTYWYYTSAKGGVPDYPKAGGFPLGESAPRAWFARLLWTAIQGTPAAP